MFVDLNIKRISFLLSLIIVCCSISFQVKAQKIDESQMKKMMQAFQADADLIRLEHLEYWTGLIEKYHNSAGTYPFQNKLDSERPGFVRIVTKQQAQYFSPNSNKYIAAIDNNARGTFQQFSINDFVLELERGLGRAIEEKYDIQKVPYKSTIGYNYFVTQDGYLLWVTCITCGVTKISTLLMDGYTPTVNIVSPGMKGKVTKALTRDEMLKHKIYKVWRKRPFQKESYIRSLEKNTEHDSKG